MAKKVEDFKSLNCTGCQCDNYCCQASNCCRCYRAEYAEEDCDDYYYEGNGEDECSEKDENFQW